MQWGRLSLVAQTSLYYFVGITRLHERGNSNKFQANHFVPIIPVPGGCKRKQNPVSIETKSNFASFKECSTTSQQIFFLLFPNWQYPLKSLHKQI